MLTVRGILIRLAALLSCVYTCSLFVFLALRIYCVSKSPPAVPDESEEPEWSLITNIALLLSFITLHSLCTAKVLKEALSPEVHRVCFNSMSSLSLTALYYYWAPCEVIYTLPLTPNTVTALHCIGWACSASCLLLMDFSEFFGFKQIWYSEQELGPPMFYKPPGAKRLLEHYRHPLAVGPILVLLASQSMTLDRLVLGAVFTLYCLTKCNLDYQDFVYLRKLIRPGKRYMYSKIVITSRAIKTKTMTPLYYEEQEDDLFSSGYESSPSAEHLPESVTKDKTPLVAMETVPGLVTREDSTTIIDSCITRRTSSRTRSSSRARG